MKRILYLTILLFLISCNKEKSIDKISISGVVSNSIQQPIDSVKVIIEETLCVQDHCQLTRNILIN